MKEIPKLQVPQPTQRETRAQSWTFRKRNHEKFSHKVRSSFKDYFSRVSPICFRIANMKNLLKKHRVSPLHSVSSMHFVCQKLIESKKMCCIFFSCPAVTRGTNLCPVPMIKVKVVQAIPQQPRSSSGLTTHSGWPVVRNHLGWC